MRLLPWPPRCCLPRALAVLGFVLFFPAGGATTARADDTVRRAQEELRKRNLYFGDIDGIANRGTIGALKRYQERKRLAVTGEADGETLRSLGIPAPHSESASAPIEPDPWPAVPVLRSDLGRRPPPMTGETAWSEDAPQPPVEVAAASERPEPLPVPSPGGNTAWEPSPAPGIAAGPPASETGLLTPEAARNFVAAYLRVGASNDLRAEMGYYADMVDYFNKGPAGLDYIRRDVSSYYKRWPQREYDILGPVTVSPGARSGETALGFQIHYRCHGPGRHAEGRTDNVFTVLGTPPGAMRIVGMKEQRVR